VVETLKIVFLSKSKSSINKRKRTNPAQQQFWTSSVQVQRSPQVPETFHLESPNHSSDNGEEEMEEESMNPWDIDSLQLSLSNPSSTGELNPRRLLNEFQNSTIGSSEMKKISCKKSPASSSQHDKEGEEDHASENADEETDLETKAHDSEYNQLHAWKTREASSHYTTVKETTHPTAHCTTVRETTHPTARPYRNVAITKPTVTITEPPLDLTDRSLDIGIDDDEDEDDDEFIII